MRMKEMPSALLLGMINLYRRWISPLKPPCCRFYPTCSAYGYEAVKRHGVWRGLVLIVWRLLRCHPLWHGDSYDPVPERFAGSVWHEGRK